jgi:hypothetical protein
MAGRKLKLFEGTNSRRLISLKTDTLLTTSGCTAAPYDRPHGQPFILNDACWGFVEASLKERQAEEFWGEEVGAQGDA